jgi:hypothetical protein
VVVDQGPGGDVTVLYLLSQLSCLFRLSPFRSWIGHAAANFAVLRRIALQRLRQETTAKIGVKAKRLRAGWDENYLVHLLTQ